MKQTLLSILFGALCLGCSAPPPPITSDVNLARAMSDERGEFAVVRPGRQFEFPADHGEHPDFKTEWWYVTGHLQDAQGRPFGFQLTFFSTGLPKMEPAAQSPWTASRVMMAHFAVSDPTGNRFESYERFSRRAIELAGIKTENSGLSIWLGDWTLRRSKDGRWELRAQQDGVGIELSLTEKKPPLLQGDRGYSLKGPDPKDASYYVSLTRLEAEGTLHFESEKFDVTGSSWFDHEWSSQAMAPGLVGWDWFSLQLDDGWELMLYLLRYEDGRLEPASSGVLVAPDGSSTKLSLSQFEVEVTARHRSPKGIEYPSAWVLRVPSEKIELKVAPTMLNQEMKSSVAYWEGAVLVEGRRGGSPITGHGFVEMTGYETGPK